MIFTWYKIFNKTEFEALGLESKTYPIIFQGVGQKEILVTKGIMVSLKYEGVFLPIKLNDKNPFIKLGETDDDLAHAVYIAENNDVYLGIEEPGDES